MLKPILLINSQPSYRTMDLYRALLSSYKPVQNLCWLLVSGQRRKNSESPRVRESESPRVRESESPRVREFRIWLPGTGITYHHQPSHGAQCALVSLSVVSAISGTVCTCIPCSHQSRSIRGMTEIPRFAWFATLFGGANSVRHFLY
jgi:hypothetical protein